MTTDVTPWQIVGDPHPSAGFGWDIPLPPHQQAALRSLELAERAEERERAERLAEHREQSENRALAESIQRAHAHGEAWSPSDPWKHYPSHSQRVEEAFAYMDMQAAAELRQAKAAAARTLREFGVAAQITIDASEPRPNLPGGSSSRLPEESQPTPEPSSDGAPPGSAQRAIRVPAQGPGILRHPVGEAQYVRMRLRRFLDRTRNEHPMTATPAEDSAAAAAQTQGEAAARQHETAAQQLHAASGSAVTVEDARTGDDTAVSWFGSGSNAAEATLNPSTPPAFNSFERDPADPT